MTLPRRGIEQHRDRERVRERHADRRRGGPGRIRLVDLLDRDQQVLAASSWIVARRAVREPDLVARHDVARHVAGVHDVVEDDEPALVRWPGCVRKLKFDVSGFDAGKLRIVQLPSIWICDGGFGVNDTVDDAVARRAGSRARTRATPAPSSSTAASNQAARPRGRVAHRCRSSRCRVMRSLVPLLHDRCHKGTETAPSRELDSGGPAVMERLRSVRPVTLRRHLSVALPLSESLQDSSTTARSRRLQNDDRHREAPYAAGKKSIG